MPNGKPGDHPITDLFVHNHDVYGNEADKIIKDIAKIIGRKQTEDWLEKEIGWSNDKEAILEKCRKKLNEVS